LKSEIFQHYIIHSFLLLFPCPKEAKVRGLFLFSNNQQPSIANHKLSTHYRLHLNIVNTLLISFLYSYQIGACFVWKKLYLQMSKMPNQLTFIGTGWGEAVLISKQFLVAVSSILEKSFPKNMF